MDNPKAIQECLSLMTEIADEVDEAIFVADVTTYQIIFANAALEAISGKKRDDLLKTECWKVIQKGRTGPCEFCPLDKLREGGENLSEIRNSLTGKWYAIKNKIIKWPDGRDVYLEVMKEITRQKEYDGNSQRFASHDMLTGVYNRLWGYKIMAEMLNSSIMDKGDMSLVFVDIDGLKLVNEQFGHEVGDGLIIKVVDLLKKNIRKSDVICRWGDDEFVLLMGCSISASHKIMKNIELVADTENATGELPYKISISYGITKFHIDNNTSIDSLISYADKLMYDSKMRKKNLPR